MPTIPGTLRMTAARVPDAEALYRILEQEAVPSYADRGVWLERVVASIAAVGARFGADRMVREYAEGSYLPAHRSR